MFIKNDGGFICSVCGNSVPKLGYTSRNHCNKCLCSRHLDDQPGDRANPCGGIMRPVSALCGGRGFVIIFKCERCGVIKRNKAADDDDTELLIKLTSEPF